MEKSEIIQSVKDDIKNINNTGELFIKLIKELRDRSNSLNDSNTLTVLEFEEIEKSREGKRLISIIDEIEGLF